MMKRMNKVERNQEKKNRNTRKMGRKLKQLQTETVMMMMIKARIWQEYEERQKEKLKKKMYV